jgi:hypothetical protein
MRERFEVVRPLNNGAGWQAAERDESECIIWRGPIRWEWADAQLDLEERMPDALDETDEAKGVCRVCGTTDDTALWRGAFCCDTCIEAAIRSRE